MLKILIVLTLLVKAIVALEIFADWTFDGLLVAFFMDGKNHPASFSTVAKYSSIFPQTCQSTFCQCIPNKDFDASPDYFTQGHSLESDELNFLSLGQMSRDKWDFLGANLPPSFVMDFSYVSWATLNKGYRTCALEATVGVAPGSTFMKSVLDNWVFVTEPIMSISGLGMALGWLGPFDINSFKNYTNYIPDWPLWTVDLTDIKVNGLSFGYNGIAVLNTAGIYSEFPLVVADSLAYFLGMERSTVVDGRQYYIASNSTCALSQNVTVNIKEDEYNLKLYQTFNTDFECTPTFVGYDQTYRGKPIYSLNYMFFVNHVVAFNYDTEIISIAPYIEY